MDASFEPSPAERGPCLVVGGGLLAERVVGPLLAGGGRVTVVSPALARGLLEIARDGRLCWWPREYVSGDVAGFSLVLAATDDAAVNRQVLAEARERGVRVALAPDVVADRWPPVLRRARRRGGRTPGGRPSRAAPAPRSSSGASREGSADGSDRPRAG